MRYLFLTLLLAHTSISLAQTPKSRGITSLHQSVATKKADADALFAAHGAVVRLSYDPPFVRCPVIYLRIGQGNLLPFLLDTGMPNALTLTEETAKNLGFGNKIEKATAQERKDGIDIQLPLVRIPLVNAPKNSVNSPKNNERAIKIENLPTVVRNLPGLSRVKTDRTGKQAVVGIVGCDLAFSLGTVRLNLPNRTLIVMRPNKEELVSPGAIRLPLKEKGQYFVKLTPPVKPPGKASPPPSGGYEFGIDTGAETTLMPRRWAIAFGAQVTPAMMRYDFWGEAIKDRELFYLPSLALPNHVEQSFVGLTAPEDWDFGILGVDFLSRFEITVDADHQQIFFKPLNKPVPPVPSFSAFTCNDAHRVEDLIVGSLPERAGLQDGDELLRVDDVPVKEATRRVIEVLHTSTVHSEASLRIRRGIQEIAIHYPRYSVASLAAPFDYGCGIEIELQRTGAGYHAYISSVVPGSPAALADLREGNEILEIGGLSVATTSWEELTARLTRPVYDSISLRVERFQGSLPTVIQLKFAPLPDLKR